MAGYNFVVWRERKTEDIGLDSARSRSGSMKVGQASPPDPEMVEKASRRRFTAEYKLRIVREAEACSPGDLGAMLRREGLYFSNLTCWRRQVAQGQLAALTPQKRGRRRRSVNPLSEKLHELERETERLRQRLQQAEEIIDLQKKSPIYGEYH